jgi:NTP pyrophosphatase (non-canonical NTP hydrolase)
VKGEERRTGRAVNNCAPPFYRRGHKEREMNWKQYTDFALLTYNHSLSPTEGLCMAALGLCGESGEASEHVKKHVFHRRELHLDDVKKELGDVLWYLAVFAHLCGLDLETIAAANVKKLQERYPDGFKSHATTQQA